MLHQQPEEKSTIPFYSNVMLSNSPSLNKHSDFQALQFNYQDNINVLTFRFQLPLLSRIIKVVNNITKTVLLEQVHQEHGDTIATLMIPTKEMSGEILHLFQLELKEKQWAKEDIINVAREVIQGIPFQSKSTMVSSSSSSSNSSNNRFHFLPNHYQQSIALESVLHDIWKAHRKMMFWSKNLQTSDVISIEEVEDPISQNERGQQLFEFSELCLEQLRIACMQRTGLFANYEGQSLNEADQNRKQQLIMVHDCIHQAISRMLMMNNCQAAELRFLPITSTNNTGSTSSHEQLHHKILTQQPDPALWKQSIELQQQTLQSINKLHTCQTNQFRTFIDQYYQPQVLAQAKESDLIIAYMEKQTTSINMLLEVVDKLAGRLFEEMQQPKVLVETIHQGIHVLSQDLHHVQLLTSHTHAQLNRGLSDLEVIKWNTNTTEKGERGELQPPLTYSTELSQLVQSNSSHEMKTNENGIPTIYNFTK